MSFPRADVKDKHLKRHHVPDEPGAEVNEHLAKKLMSARQERSRQACDECRSRKLKCDNVHPCRSCHTKGLTCKVSSDRKGPGRPRNGSTLSPPHTGPQDVSPQKSDAMASLSGETLTSDTTPAGLFNNGLDITRVTVPVAMPMSADQLLQVQSITQFGTTETSLTAGNVDLFADGDFMSQDWWDLSLADGLWQLPLVYSASKNT